MQEKYNIATFVEEFLNNYSEQEDLLEFPTDDRLDLMYNQLYDEYYDLGTQYQYSGDVDTQQFGGLLWLFLIGSLYRRYPYYRRRRGRRFRRRRQRAYGYSTKELMEKLHGN